MGAKSDRTKNALADALERLLQEMPLAKVTVRAVTQQANVDRQTFYYHFETMSDLVAFVCRRQLSSLMDAASTSKTTHDLFTLVISEVDAHRSVLAPLLANVGRPTMREVFYDVVNSVLAQQAQTMLAKLGTHPTDEQVQFAVQYCQFASVSLVIDWLMGKLSATPEHLANQLSEAFEQQMHGLAATCALP